MKGGVDAENAYGLDGSVPVGLLKEQKNELLVLLRKDEEVTVKEERKRALSAPVKRGEHAGKVTYMLNGKALESFDIVTLDSVEKRDAEWCFDKTLQLILL